MTQVSTPSDARLIGSESFFVEGDYVAVDGREVMHGQMYVRCVAPEFVTRPYPLILIPGAGLTGACYEFTPDGRPGWAPWFAQRGYAVYVVDQVGRGRSAHHDRLDPPRHAMSVVDVERNFTAPASYNTYPQAGRHTQWPGTGRKGDPVFDRFFASMVPSTPDLEAATSMRRTVGELLRRLGPSVLVTHSQSGLFAWPITDDQPELVAANILIEGAQNLVTMQRLGPPDWFGYGEVKAPWGITNVPITYDPPVTDPAELTFVQEEVPARPDLIRCHLQALPARQLPRLQGPPILSVVGEASFGSAREHSLQTYLAQAGVEADFVRLEEVGIYGNGHLMMLEQNNLEISGFLHRWLTAQVETPANRRRLVESR